MEPNADIALIGLAVMGQNLILNMNDHGFVVAYPVNVWLVAVGLKHGMGTQRALGKGGHSSDLEQVWQRMIRRGRAAHGRRFEHPAAAGHSH